MTDNLTVEGDGAGGQPNSPVSKPAIEGADALSKLLDEKLDKMLKPVLGELRGLQSRQDKSDKSVREFVDEYENQKKSGKNPAEAEVAATQVIDERKRQVQREALFDEMAKKLGLVPDQPVGNGAERAVDVAKVIERTQVDPQSPDIVALTSRKWETEDALELALFRHKAGTPQPTGADTSAPPTSPPPSPDAKAIEAKMVQLNRMYKNPSKHKNELAALEKELEAYLPK